MEAGAEGTRTNISGASGVLTHLLTYLLLQLDEEEASEVHWIVR